MLLVSGGGCWRFELRLSTSAPNGREMIRLPIDPPTRAEEGGVR